MTSGDSRNIVRGDHAALVLLVVVSTTLIIAAVLAPLMPSATGLAGGVALAGGTLSLFVGVTVTSLIRQLGSLDPARPVHVGPGSIGLIVAGGLGIATFAASLAAPAARFEPLRRGMGRSSALGALAAVVTSIGLVLPPVGSRVPWRYWLLLDHAPNGLVTTTYLAVLLSPALAGGVGFVVRRRWGLHLALGVIVPFAWIFLVTSRQLHLGAAETRATGLAEVFRLEDHPLFGIGVAGMALCSLFGMLVQRWAPTPAPVLSIVDDWNAASPDTELTSRTR
jgi:hypothetical protein